LKSVLAEEGGNGNASDPTASVNYADLRFQAFDLDGTADRDRFAVEGAYMIAEGHKITYELNYWDTNITGKDESGLESVKLKYINLQPKMLSSGLKYKLAIGVEVIHDLGEVSDGIGSGTDQIAPLFGAGWSLNDRNFVITLVQYFHSFSEDANAQKVRTTGPRLIWIYNIPDIGGWLKVDDKFSIDHENDNHSSNILEFQLGKMFTPTIGGYIEYLTNTGGIKQYEDGFGVGLRIAF
jgi:hypothetical protein